MPVLEQSSFQMMNSVCGVLGFKFEALLHNSKLVDIKQWLFSSSILEKVNASLPSGRNAAKVSFLM